MDEYYVTGHHTDTRVMAKDINEAWTLAVAWARNNNEKAYYVDKVVN